MNVVMIVQHGKDGPVKAQLAAGKDPNQAIHRVIKRLQEGTPEHLHVRLVLDGDERLEERLAQEWADWHRGRGWHDIPGNVLLAVPLEIPRWPYGEAEERQRVALLSLEDL